MRKLDYFVCALGCGLSAIPMSCSSKTGNGVEGDGTGGAGFNNTGGAQFQAVGGNYVPNTSTSANAGGTTSASSTSTGCAQQEVPIKTLPPDIMIILDRSMSMTQTIDAVVCTGGNPAGDALCGEESKWYKTIVAIKDVVNATQSKVNWGLFYLGNEAQTCGASTSPAVGITEGDSYTPIAASIDEYQFDGQVGTPTAAVVGNAVRYLQTLTDQNPKFLLLATDGEPNCATSGSFSADTAGATKAIATAYGLNIPTFVIGIATSTVATATTLLNDAANAGGHPLTGATQYYAVSDTQALSDALTQIISIAASCTISLDNTPKSTDWSIAITATDTAGATVIIPTDANNGWGYTDASKSAITLVGSACDNLKSGAYSNIKFVYTCADQPFIF